MQPSGRKHLVDPRLAGRSMSRITRPSATGRDIGIGPRQVDAPGVCNGQRRDRLGMGQVGDIQDLDPFGVAGVGIAELGLDGARMLQERLAEHRRYVGVLRVIERHDDEPGVAGDVGDRSRRS